MSLAEDSDVLEMQCLNYNNKAEVSHTWIYWHFFRLYEKPTHHKNEKDLKT